MNSIRFDLKIAATNFFQLFIIGYITMCLILIVWAGFYDYGRVDLVELMLSPALWLAPMCVALIVAITRGVAFVTQLEDSIECIEQDARFSRFSSWPTALKVLTVSLLIFFAVSPWLPSFNINDNQIALLENKARELNDPTLFDLLDDIQSDERVTANEFQYFLFRASIFERVK